MAGHPCLLSPLCVRLRLHNYYCLPYAARSESVCDTSEEERRKSRLQEAARWKHGTVNKTLVPISTNAPLGQARAQSAARLSRLTASIGQAFLPPLGQPNPIPALTPFAPVPSPGEAHGSAGEVLSADGLLLASSHKTQTGSYEKHQEEADGAMLVEPRRHQRNLLFANFQLAISPRLPADMHMMY
ncbi:hypothetical protein K469DRAFT_681738 [Zopfia rhizophila CBS 207.26]|uniref:Uncharacterized protein n=1 Tax=Zopfia rhizophila CBS 207.26 TaxID=1314779 RepID=A0A6A6EVX5_9PEZI|nr:hypothetical protein K469DRAFT_681738 [Zopfia rhizophila CBS 207.26]